MSLAAEQLKAAFDRTFAQARVPAVKLERLLGVRVGADLHAVRLAEVAGLHLDLKCVPFPAPHPHLLGVAGVRGALLPVFHLGGLLGYPKTTGALRWLLVSKGAEPVGFAFEQFERYFHLPANVLTERAGAAQTHVRESATVDGAQRPVVSIHSLQASLAARLKER